MKFLSIAFACVLFCVCFFSKQLPYVPDFVNKHIDWVWILGPFSWALYQGKGLLMFLIGLVLFGALLSLGFKSKKPLVVKGALFAALLEWLAFGWLFYAPLA